jgi:hypothetical protein
MPSPKRAPPSAPPPAKPSARCYRPDDGRAHCAHLEVARDPRHARVVLAAVGVDHRIVQAVVVVGVAAVLPGEPGGEAEDLVDAGAPESDHVHRPPRMLWSS